MGETGACDRCGAAYPWPREALCSRPHGQGRGYRYAIPGGEEARRHAREQETRAALGTTPITQSDLIREVLGQPAVRRGRAPASERFG